MGRRGPKPGFMRDNRKTKDLGCESGRPQFYFVYVIASGAGPVKIGISRDVRFRLSQLQHASAFPLRLAFAEMMDSEIDARIVEKNCHKRLRAYRLRGEWFDSGVDAAVSVVSAEVAFKRKCRMDVMAIGASVRNFGGGIYGEKWNAGGIA